MTSHTWWGRVSFMTIKELIHISWFQHIFKIQIMHVVCVVASWCFSKMSRSSVLLKIEKRKKWTDNGEWECKLRLVFIVLVSVKVIRVHFTPILIQLINLCVMLLTNKQQKAVSCTLLVRTKWKLCKIYWNANTFSFTFACFKDRKNTLRTLNWNYVMLIHI